MSEYTKGPWALCKIYVDGLPWPDHVAGRPMGSSDPICSFPDDQHRSREEALANGGLIALAPTMLLDTEALALAADKRSQDYANQLQDPDLDDEQPVHITVTLGDLRRAQRTRDQLKRASA